MLLDTFNLKVPMGHLMIRLWIMAEVDTAPEASGDMPGRLVFSTTADGASSPTKADED